MLKVNWFALEWSIWDCFV